MIFVPILGLPTIKLTGVMIFLMIIKLCNTFMKGTHDTWPRYLAGVSLKIWSQKVSARIARKHFLSVHNQLLGEKSSDLKGSFLNRGLITPIENE